jgi:WD40-like Beta Propeller Repeat
MHRSHFGLVSALILAGACGDGGSITTPGDGGTGAIDAPSSPEIPGLASIAISPSNPTVFIEQDVGPTQAFTADGAFMDGHHEDITTRVAWTLDKVSLGRMMGPMFIGYTTFGGRTLITATAGTKMGSTQLSIGLHKSVNDPDATNLPADPGSVFAGPADPARNPDVVYPNDGALLPPNLLRLEVHFRPAAGNTLFDVNFTNGLTDVHVYTRCVNPIGGGCIYRPAPAVWLYIAETNRGADPLNVSVRGTDDAGSAVGVSGPVTMSFSRDDIFGGIYYWGISNGNGAIYRYDFAGAQTTAQPFISPADAGGNCIGCHSLSRDGFKMVTEANGQNGGRLLLLDVVQKMPIVPFGSGEKSIFESWNPDATQYVGVYGDDNATDFNLMIIDGATATKLQSIPIGGTSNADAADHPDWSPDGDKIVFTKIGKSSNDVTLQRMHQGAIQMVTKTGSTWSAADTLVAAVPGENHFYPAFSPDSKIIAFNRSVCPPGNDTDRSCNADGDPSAKVYTIPTDKSKPPISLARLNAGGKEDGAETNLTNSFPKWCPFEFHRTGELGTRLMWITFSSGRAYGLYGPPSGALAGSNGDGDATTGKLVWMAGIDPDAALRGEDSSFTAFVLPYQGFETSNHIAQWTERVREPIP